jgi:hypothetical protein
MASAIGQCELEIVPKKCLGARGRGGGDKIAAVMGEEMHRTIN